MSSSDFRNFPLWQQAMDIAVGIHEVTAGLTREYLYGVVAQVRASSNSIPAHVAEAFGRNFHGDKLNYYYYARGAVYETLSHLEYCNKVGIITNEYFLKLTNKLRALETELETAIKSIRNQQATLY